MPDTEEIEITPVMVDAAEAEIAKWYMAGGPDEASTVEMVFRAFRVMSRLSSDFRQKNRADEVIDDIDRATRAFDALEVYDGVLVDLLCDLILSFPNAFELDLAQARNQSVDVRNSTRN